MYERFKFRYLFDDEIYDVLKIDYDQRFICLKKDDEKPFLTILDYSKLLQCSVYKNKIGKEGRYIYESDIVQSEGYDTLIYGEVKFGNDRNCNIGFYIDWHDKHKSLRQDLLFWIKETNLEIVGNIYKNPELLKKNGGQIHG